MCERTSRESSYTGRASFDSASLRAESESDRHQLGPAPLRHIGHAGDGVF